MYIGRIKERARDALKYNWGNAIIASLVASICGVEGASANFTFSFGGSEEAGGTDMGDAGAIDTFFEENLQFILTILGGVILFALLVGAIMFCLGSIVSVGYQKFNLDLVDGKSPEIGTLFTYFPHWKNLILTNLLSTVYIFLFTLLCVIPGIVVSFKYAMVPFVLAEDPTLSPQKALDRSAELMHGHKWDLFKLKLSFTGWIILCTLTCGIGFIWLTPYMNASIAEFYRVIYGTRTEYGDGNLKFKDNGNYDFTQI